MAKNNDWELLYSIAPAQTERQAASSAGMLKSGYQPTRTASAPARSARAWSSGATTSRPASRDPLGVPIDGLGDIVAEDQRVLEVQAPSVMNRQPVKEPLQPGIKAIDAMTPIGRGQRELIIGDRKTGKTAVCVDTILNQRAAWATGDPKQQVRCVYVAVGQTGHCSAWCSRRD